MATPTLTTSTLLVRATPQGPVLTHLPPRTPEDRTRSTGGTVQLDGTGSTDPENDILTYSWSPSTNLDNSSIATPIFSGIDDSVTNLTLTVTQIVGGDVAFALNDAGGTTVTVNNVPPTVTANGDTIDEDKTATITGTIPDPGTLDSFVVTIDWGEGLPVDYNYPAGSTSYSETHQYLDDEPTGTASDIYDIDVTVTMRTTVAQMAPVHL